MPSQNDTAFWSIRSDFKGTRLRLRTIRDRRPWAGWLPIAVLNITMSRAIDPVAPIAWTTIGFRVASGFVITSAVYGLFQRPRLRQFGRPLRWLLICLATASLLVGSL